MAEFDDVTKWMETKHKGFKCRLVAKDIPGELWTRFRMWRNADGTTGAGRGLFAVDKIPVRSSRMPCGLRPFKLKSQAGETILEIPASALLNPLTLAASNTIIPDNLFPVSNSSSSSHAAKRAKTTRRSDVAAQTNWLNTTQLLTLYLALNRDPKAAKSSPWAKYLGTLPKSFAPWHPLTWYYEEGYEGWWKKPIRFLPTSARLKLEDVKRRYEEDAAVLKDVLVCGIPVCLGNCVVR